MDSFVKKYLIAFHVLCLFFLANGEDSCTFEYQTIFLVGNFPDEELPLYNRVVCSCSFYENFQAFGYDSELEDQNNNELIIGPQPNDWETFERLEQCSSFVYTGFNLNIVNTNFFLWNKNLVQIFLNDSNVRHIQPGAFNGLPELIELYLQNNNLQNLTDGLFSALIKLKVLVLDNNKINYISDYAFMGLNNLIILSLKSNYITTLNEISLRPLQHLKVLNVSDNPLENISLNRLSLMQLSLQNLGLTTVTTIKPDSTSLSIDNGNLKLRTQVVHIALLDLSQNKFEELQDFAFSSADNLGLLNLSSNAISRISLKTFATLSNVSTLDLSHNYLRYITQGVFNDLTKLEVLDLSANRIKNIDYGCFEELLSTLRILNLSYNSIKTCSLFLPVYSSLKNQNGVRLNLYLNNNQLSDLHINSEYLSSISLDGNLWSCQKLSELINTLQKPNIEILPGNSLNISNIYKIGCNDTPSLAVSDNLDVFSKIDQNTAIEKLLQTFFSKFDSSFEKSGLETFFRGGFHNTAFYKFFKHYNSSIKNSIRHEAYFNVSQFQNFSRDSEFYNAKNAHALVEDEGKKDHNNILIFLYFLTFALYAIICILVIFLFIFIKRKTILKYNVTKDQLM